MNFSYIVGGRAVLTRIDVPVRPGEIVHISGVFNERLACIGGIVAGLFPVESSPSIPVLEKLLELYNGELVVHDGEVPQDVEYMGPDPEKHVFFSRVDEEIHARLGATVDGSSVIASFGLDGTLLTRRIATLSGGEKMKLALSILFSKNASCYVLHGILPWLDADGKARLRALIERVRRGGGTVIYFERESDEPARKLTFDGSRLIPHDEPRWRRLRGDFERKAVSLRRQVEGGGSRDVVEMVDVWFRYHTRESGDFSLRGVNMSLSSSSVYGLVGDNGSGKSTIARLLMRMERPDRGTIRLAGWPVESASRDQIRRFIAYVGQFPEQQLVLSDVESYRERLRAAGNTFVIDLLARHFDPERRHPISLLSPLDQKILCLASMLCAETGLVILDEPTWGLDETGEILLLDSLLSVFEKLESACLLTVSHDRRFLDLLCSRLYFLENGMVYEHAN